MSILLDRASRVIVQGITGRMAQFHTKEMLDYGTNVVGGVVPGKGGETVFGIPVFDTVKQAVAATGADTSLVFVPPPFAADSIMEAADAGIRYCVCITDGIPAQDMILVKRYMMRYPRERRMVLTGPNCAGTISPGKALLGIMPGHIYLPGNVGIVSRSGTLGYEAAQQLKDRGIGVSTSVGIGGDPINGSSFRDILERFEADPDTVDVVIIGGGDTGADCLGTAIRQGAASITQLEIMPRPPDMRAGTNPWPQWSMVYRTSSAHEEGGERVFSVNTERFLADEHGNVRAIVLNEVVLSNGKFEIIEGTERELPCDLVLLALGFVGPEKGSWLDQLGVALDDRGNIARTDAYATNVPGVYVAGDMGRGQSLIVWAIAEGRACAAAVDERLMGSTTLPSPIVSSARPLA